MRQEEAENSMRRGAEKWKGKAQFICEHNDLPSLFKFANDDGSVPVKIFANKSIVPEMYIRIRLRGRQ